MLDKERISVFAPATVANVGCGFDIFGLALNEPGDRVDLELSAQPGVYIQNIAGDDGKLPDIAEKNTAGKSLIAMLQYLKADFGMNLCLTKEMPVGSGLGSSAASSVASVYALNSMLKKPLPLEEVLNFAKEGEKIASGSSVHLDNIAACLYGGFILIRSKEPPDIVRVPVPDDMHLTVLHPRIEVKTAATRRMIKSSIELPQAVTQWGNVAGVVTGLFTSDYELIKRSMTDVIIEPIRSILIPHYYALKECALETGAYGFGISGSGPSVFAISRSLAEAKKIGNELTGLLAEKGINYDLYLSAVNLQGPKIL